jgi:hypothetical protein
VLVVFALVHWLASLLIIVGGGIRPNTPESRISNSRIQDGKKERRSSVLWTTFYEVIDHCPEQKRRE